MTAPTEKRGAPNTAGGMSLVILAAGVGSRYGGLKQLEPIGPSGETLLEYSIFDALRAGFNHLILVIRREAEDHFRSSLGHRLTEAVDISHCHQVMTDLPNGFTAPEDRVKPWGTGHAVLATEDTVKGPFVVVNADDFYGLDAFRSMAEFMAMDTRHALPTFALAGFAAGPTLSAAGPVSRGLCRATASGWLKGIVEVPELRKVGNGGGYTDASGVDRFVPADDLVSMNMWGFTPAVFGELRERFIRFLERVDGRSAAKEEFLIPDAVQGMIADGSARVRVIRHQGQWCGITFREDRELVRGFMAGLVTAGEYPERLWR